MKNNELQAFSTLSEAKQDTHQSAGGSHRTSEGEADRTTSGNAQPGDAALSILAGVATALVMVTIVSSS